MILYTQPIYSTIQHEEDGIIKNSECVSQSAFDIIDACDFCFGTTPKNPDVYILEVVTDSGKIHCVGAFESVRDIREVIRYIRSDAFISLCNETGTDSTTIENVAVILDINMCSFEV